MENHLRLRRGNVPDQASAPALPLTDAAVRRQLADAAGAERFQNRDPSYHLTESFCQTFDRIGQKKAALALSDTPALLERPAGPQMSLLVPGLSEKAGGIDPRGQDSMREQYRAREENGTELRRFAEVAFQRGRLSAAILQGTGKMMLFSCLKNTVGQEPALRQRERMLFQSSSSHRLVPQGRGQLSVVNKGYVKSALGLVVDTLQDARQSLLSLTALAESGGPGSETLLREYPFLSDAPERVLLAQYRARLAELKGPSTAPERQVLLRAEEKALLQIQKKAQIKEQFLQTLRQLTDQALQAQLLFSEPEFRQEAETVLEETFPDAPPPPDDGGEAPPDEGDQPRDGKGLS
ncbi:MAG: hypothetical protein ACI4JC_00250 [Faecalibacterium sp.]